MTPFFCKGCFLTWLKNWVLLIVLLKSCVFWKHYFIVFSAKHSFSNSKIVCRKITKFMKNSGLVLNVAKWIFLCLFFFQVFIFIVVCFWCVWHSSKSVKNVCFPSFLGLLWVAYSCWFGFGRFRCSCVSCVWFPCLCCFVSVLFALFLFCCWIVLGVGSCSVVFVVFFCFFVSCFCFGGFKGQVRWPKGPPHLALNPPYFLFVFFVFVFFLAFLSVFAFARKNPCFPPKKGIFGFFLSVSLCFSLASFGPPLFALSLSFSLSLSLSCSFLSSFLSVSHFAISLLFFLFVLFAFLFQDVTFLLFVLLVVLFCFESSCWISFCFASCFLLLLFFCFCCFAICFLIFGNISKTSLKKWKLQKQKKWKMQTNGHFDKSS